MFFCLFFPTGNLAIAGRCGVLTPQGLVLCIFCKVFFFFLFFFCFLCFFYCFLFFVETPLPPDPPSVPPGRRCQSSFRIPGRGSPPVPPFRVFFFFFFFFPLGPVICGPSLPGRNGGPAGAPETHGANPCQKKKKNTGSTPPSGPRFPLAPFGLAEAARQAGFSPQGEFEAPPRFFF